MWDEIEQIVKRIMPLLDSNGDSLIKEEVPVLLSTINNASKYKDPYKSCMPSDKVWTVGTDNPFIKSLHFASKNPDSTPLFVMEEESFRPLRPHLRNKYFLDEMRVKLFQPNPYTFVGRVYSVQFGSTTVNFLVTMPSHHCWTGEAYKPVRSNANPLRCKPLCHHECVRRCSNHHK